MKTALQLGKMRKVVLTAQAQTLADEKAARIARETAQAAKIKLKYARKITKLARKAAKNARRKVAESLEALNRARKKLKKLEKRVEHHQRKSRRSSQKKLRAKARRKTPAKKKQDSTRSASPIRNPVQPKQPVAKVTSRKPLIANESLRLPGDQPPGTPGRGEPDLNPDADVLSPIVKTGVSNPSPGVPAA